MAIPTLDRETIRQAVQKWPLADQMTLAQEILQRATAQIAHTPQRPSWREMAGMAANDQEPPTDEQVAQWLDEHRMEKYGG